MEFKRILISSLLIASVTASTSCSSDFFKKRINSPQAAAKQMVYAPELNPGVHELITDHSFKSLENDEPLRFETAVTPEEAANGTPVELKDNSGKTVSKMYDDGTHSDRIAGDGIYTCSYKPAPKDETSFSYTAKIGDTSTEPTSVRYFDKITDDDVKDINKVAEKITEIQSKYIDREGYVPYDKREENLDAVGEYVKELYNKGEAVEYRVNKEYDNIVVKLSSGISYVYSNPIANFEDGTGTGSVPNTTSAAPETSYDIKELTVRGFRPYASDYPSIGATLSSNMALITNEFSPNITSGGILENSDISPKTIDTFGPDQVIIWRGHGGYDGYVHSFLSTTACYSVYTKDDYDEDDLIENRLLLNFVPTDYDLTHDGYNYFYPVSITAEYINHHCPDMTNSFVYIGACYGARDSVLAASFINKNCNVVIGFSNSVYIDYDNNIMGTLLTKMCEKNNENGDGTKYYTVLEALTAAKSIWGDNDSSGIIDDLFRSNAEPVIFGNRDYRFADAINETLTQPSSEAAKLGTFQLGTYNVTINEFDRYTVPVTEYPDGYDWFDDFIWTTDNEEIAYVEEYGVVYGISKGHTTGRVVSKDGLFSQEFAIFVN